MTWTDLKANFLGSPKSTITGVCSLAIAVMLAILALPPHAKPLLIGVAVLRAYIDFTKQDAGKAMALVPGDPTPKLVPAHETPDDPAAVPVAEANPPQAQ